MTPHNRRQSARTRTTSAVARGVIATLVAASGLFVVPAVAGPQVAHAAPPTPVSLTVTTNADSGAGSLRSALATAETNLASGVSSTIGFASTYSISLLSTLELSPAAPVPGGATVTIQGPVTLDGGGARQILNLDGNLAGGVSVAIDDVTFRNGRDTLFGGGAIIAGSNGDGADDSLTITNSDFENNTAAAPDADGGAILFAGGDLSVSGSTFTGNSTQADAASSGGAIEFDAAGTSDTLSVTGSTFQNNSASGSGGAIDANTIGGGLVPALTLTHNVFTGNATVKNGNAVAVTAIGTVTSTANAFTPAAGNLTQGDLSAASGATLHSTHDFFLGSEAAIVATGATATAANEWFGGAGGPAHATFAGVTPTPLHVTATATQTTASIGQPLPLAYGFADDGTGTAVAFTDLPAVASDDASWSYTSTDSAALFDETPPAGTANVSPGTGGSQTVTAHFLGSTSTNGIATTQPIAVDQAPAITVFPPAYTATAGRSSTFTVTVTGTPAPTLAKASGPAWVDITPVSGGTFTVGGTPGDADVTTGAPVPLTLTASNGVGSPATVTVQVTVDPAPVAPSTSITASASNVHPGDSVTFTATASGVPAPTLKWQKAAASTPTDFQDIAGATGASYTASGLTLADNGTLYRALATNSVASVPSNVLPVGVGDAPVISGPDAFGLSTGPIPNASQTFQVTGSDVTVSASPLPTGVILENPSGTTWDFRALVMGAPSGTTTVTVTATSAFGSDTKQVQLTLGTAPFVSTDPADAYAVSGGAVEFTAASVGDSPAATVQWQRSTDGGASFSDIAGATDTTLEVTAAAGLDGAQYQAVFSNVVGSATTSVATLHVGTAPGIAFPTDPVLFTAGGTGSVSFDLSGTGSDSATPVVAAGSPALPAGVAIERPSGSTSGPTWVFHQTAGAAANSDDTYTLSVTTPYGTATQDVRIVVGSAPTLGLSSTEQWATTNSTGAAVTVTATGYPAPAVTWQQAPSGSSAWTDVTSGISTSVSGTTTTSTLAPPTASNGTIQYRATATNALGSSSPVIALVHVLAAPTVTADADVWAQAADGTVTVPFSFATDDSFLGATGGPGSTVTIAGTQGTLTVPVPASGLSHDYVLTITTGHTGTATQTVTIHGGAAPSVAAGGDPQPVATIPNVPVSFTVVPAGFPLPTVQWQKSVGGGAFADIPGATSATYTVTPALADNGTRYQAVLTNRFGDTTSAVASLAVGNRSILTNPTTLQAHVGDPVTFPLTSVDPFDTVVTSGLPAGLSYDSTSRSIVGQVAGNVDTTATLTPHSQFGDGPAQSLHIVIGTDPVVTTQPAPQVARAGTTAEFTASASGFPTPTVQWQKSVDGVAFTDIAGATGTTLDLAANLIDDGTQYRAVFTNAFSTATSNAAPLSVGNPPVLANAAEIDLPVGAAASVPLTVQDPSHGPLGSVTVAGTLPPGISLDPATKKLVGTPTQMGEYTVRLTPRNEFGTGTAVTVKLVVGTAPTVQADPAEVFAADGTTAAFTAAADGTPAPTVQWQLSVPGGAFADIPGETNPSLDVTAALAGDGNRYRAVFTNVFGTATTAPALLHVGVPPTLTSPRSLTTVKGQPLDFALTADAAISTIDVTGQLPAGLSYDAATHAIVGTPTATGVWSVALAPHNVYGDGATQLLVIEVDESVSVAQQPASVTAVIGQRVEFTAAANGYPVPTVQWQVSTDGGATFTDIPGENFASLALTAAAADSGNRYRAVFTTPGASVETEAATLTVHAPVTITSAPDGTFTRHVSGTEIPITASGTGAITLSLSGTLPQGLAFTDAGDGTGTISGTAAGDAGSFPVTITAHGFGPDATAKLVVTVADAPLLALPNPLPLNFDGPLSGVPSDVARGSTFTVTGTGFAPFAPVQFGVYSSPIALTTAVADAAGAVSATVTVPTALENGAHSLVAIAVSPAGAARLLGTHFTLADPAGGSGTGGSGAGGGSGSGATGGSGSTGGSAPGDGGSGAGGASGGSAVAQTGTDAVFGGVFGAGILATGLVVIFVTRLRRKWALRRH